MPLFQTISRTSIYKDKIFTFLVLALVTLGLSLGIGWFQTQQALSQSGNHEFYVSLDGNDANDGSLNSPWATLNHAASVLKAGDTVYVREGVYHLTAQIRATSSGSDDHWITYRAYPGEQVVLDANDITVDPPLGRPPYAHDQGAFQLENVQYVEVKDLTITNSHNSGITVRNSDHIKLQNNTIENPFSPGIGVWNSMHQTVVGNTVINANDPDMAGFPNEFPETPHEAISLGSVEDFEVAYNLVRDGQKEGIDIKEESKHGTVHHNYVHHMQRQGLYVDSWGHLEDIEFAHNVVHDCKGTGFAISVEGGSVTRDIRFHHNLLYNNWGTGIFFSRWGQDGLRENIQIYNNTVHHNGDGEPNPGEEFYWITGGLYLFSDHLRDIQIRNNIFSNNTGFQIGYSDRYLATHPNINDVLAEKAIAIDHNLIFGDNWSDRPIYAGWPPDNYANIYGINGSNALLTEPAFIDPNSGNFYLQQALSADSTNSTSIGAFPSSEEPNLWWQTDFPPQVASE